MTPFPLPLSEIFGHWGAYIVYFLIGSAFGAVLEMAGFAISTRLAAQFYLKDLTVLKVMFTGIIVAMILIFAAAGLGLLDYNLIWVNPTYLWPGIIGGLIMGVGFIIGGFCPGTSLVSAATGKIDGLLFSVGALIGMFAFGETVGLFEDFWNSSALGRFTLQDLLGVDAGVVVVAVTLMALFVFWGGEQLERIVGKGAAGRPPRWRYGAAAFVGVAALGVAVIGQPTVEDRWGRLAEEKGKLLADRAVQIHPAELLTLMRDDKLQVRLLDVRSEADFNQFHILDAERLAPQDVKALVAEAQSAPANMVFVVAGNDERAATEMWKTLVAESVPNVYILEGGVNAWLDLFADADFKATHRVSTASVDELRYTFDAALGDRFPAAEPNADIVADLAFTQRVQLQVKRGPGGGGCG